MSTSETLTTSKEKLDNWLHQKNYFTDVLEKIEQKTGVKRIYQFLGNNGFVINLIPRAQSEGVFFLFRFGWNICALSGIRLRGRPHSNSAWFRLSCLPIVSSFRAVRSLCYLHSAAICIYGAVYLKTICLPGKIARFFLV